MENRLPGGASNPYLVMAGVLAAGLDGLRNRIEPPAPVEGIAYGMEGVTDLPQRLEQALDAFEADATLRAALGEEFTQAVRCRQAPRDREGPRRHPRVRPARPSWKR